VIKEIKEIKAQMAHPSLLLALQLMLLLYLHLLLYHKAVVTLLKQMRTTIIYLVLFIYQMVHLGNIAVKLEALKVFKVFKAHRVLKVSKEYKVIEVVFGQHSKVLLQVQPMKVIWH
jgi:hypothetical protein